MNPHSETELDAAIIGIDMGLSAMLSLIMDPDLPPEAADLARFHRGCLAYVRDQFVYLADVATIRREMNRLEVDRD